MNTAVAIVRGRQRRFELDRRATRDTVRRAARARATRLHDGR